MRGAALPRPCCLTLLVWLLCLPPPPAACTAPPPTPLSPQTPAAAPPATPEGHAERRGTSGSPAPTPVAPAVPGHATEPRLDDPPRPPTTTGAEEDVTEAAAWLDLPLGGSEGRPGDGQLMVTRPSLPPSTTTTSSAATTEDDAAAHRHRHHHAAAPLWLMPHLDDRPAAAARLLEEDIAAVFRDVAYGGSTSYRSVPVRRPGTREAQPAPRVERTTVVSDEELLDDYLSDGSDLDDTARNESLTPAMARPDGGVAEAGEAGNETVTSQLPAATTTDNSTTLVHDPATLDPHDDPDTDLPDSLPPEATDRSDAPSVTPQWQVTNGTEATPIVTAAPRTASPPPPPPRPAPRLSWLDVLRCTHRGLAWVLVNFFLGVLLLALSLLGPYRLLALPCCTPLLPRTHYVAVHLLVFVAASLKAVYLFHLAFGSRGRLPLVLLLLLTNTGFPCLASAFLVLMMMMFVAADVQVYKSRLATPHNAFVFLVVVLALGFVADVIVGCAHSRSVLVLSRVMVIGVAVAAVLVFLRRQQAVAAAAQMMQREFQGELKLLVLPAKDDSLHRQMGIKHILRARLGLWCRAVRVAAAGLALLSLVHLLHTVFLVSAHVPAWAWWLFHVTGCLVEALLAVSTCVAAALTQRYDENVSFTFSFVVPPMLVRRKAASRPPSAAAAAPGDAETIYQRVSFSSGTESTQYTACCPEGGLALAGTPQAPRRRGAPVKRSATFSHAPHLPYASPHLYGPTAGPLQVGRVGSASNLPLYGPASARGSMYGRVGAPRSSLYGPAGDPSVLVHEDGFVRVRTPLDPREAPPPRPHGSFILLQQAHFRGSTPQLRAGPEVPPRQDSMYQSLSRRRKGSRGRDVLQNNIDVSESEYQSSPSSRVSRGWHSNLSSPHSPARDEPDYYSLSRRGGRGLYPDQGNYDAHSLSWRRRSHRDAQRDAYLNNLDRPEADTRSLTRRQVSHEDNNDPVHHHDLYAAHRPARDARTRPLNVYEEEAAHPRPSTLGGSPGLAHKVSNRSFSPSSPATPPAGPAPLLAESPRTRRQARFPRPFVRVGSNRSLQGEDLYTGAGAGAGVEYSYLPRGHPLRRNHSSAGYFPSRYMAPSTPSLVEAQRYGSLRLARTKTRQPGLVLTPDGKLINRYPEEWLRTRTPEAGLNGPEEGEAGAAPPRECPSRQSTSSKRSGEGGADQDWATELIRSSSILADFYSLANDQKKARRRDKEKDKQEILEEKEIPEEEQQQQQE